MGTALDKVVAHFKSLEMTEVEVPEWGLTIYVAPLNMLRHAELMRVQRQAKTDADLALSTVILLAMDETGEPLFDKGEKVELRANGAAKVMGRVSTELVTAGYQDSDADDDGEVADDDDDAPKKKGGKKSSVGKS